MNTLNKRLEKLLALLEKQGDRFEGAAWNKNLSAFDKALTKFEGQLEDLVKDAKPGMREFLKFLENPSHKPLFKHPFIGKLYRDIVGKRLPADAKPAAIKKTIIESVKESGDPKTALASTQAILAEATTPATAVPRDKEQLLLELQRLGGLSDEQFDYELSTRFKKKTDYEALAKAANIPVKEREKTAILTAIKQTALRLHGHHLQF